MDPQRLLARFLRYVAIDTTADPDSGTSPSSPGQLELGRSIAEELSSLGLSDVRHDAHGLVHALVPGSGPTILWNAHLDTSPETSGRNVRPVVWRDYDGRDLELPGDRSKILRPADEPELAALLGHTIITSDGTTLLGADDKAGLAVIVEAAAWLIEHPELPRSPIRICFTCDEEIGHGVDHLDPASLGACVGYTLDGGGTNQIDIATFSADMATVTIRGVNIHPSIAKGRMVNAVRAAAHFVERLPRSTMSPEATDGRDGFLHPYAIEGGVAEVRLRILLRDFDTAKLAEHARLLQAAAASTRESFPGASIEVAVCSQYRNLAEGLAREPRAVRFAEEALRRLGRTPSLTIIRGGTDGAHLTQRGLPTPNLSTGEHNPHSPLEWTCLEEMSQAVEWLVSLAGVWAQAG